MAKFEEFDSVDYRDDGLDDFDLNTGVDIDDLNIEMGEKEYATYEENGHINNSTKGKTKSSNGINPIQIGIVGIIIIVLLIGGVKLVKNFVPGLIGMDREEKTQTEEPVEQNNVKENSGAAEQTQVTQSVVIDMGENSSSNVEDSWTKIDGSAGITFTKIESSFTVTDVNFYVKKITNGKDSMEIKATLTGNISGLVGNYNLDVPYDIGQKLSIGSVFKITYNIADYNGSSVIEDINY